MSGSRIVQETYFSNAFCNVFSQSSYTFSGFASNFDTPYYGQVALANDVGLGPYSCNIGFLTTPLPINTLPTFATASNLDLNARFKTYYPNCNGYLYSTRSNIPTVINGNLLSPSLVFDYMNNGLFSNIISINDSNNPGRGLSNYSFTAGYCNDTSKTNIQLNYTLNNTLYNNINTPLASDILTNNTNLYIQLSNIQDVYTDGNKTGYFLKAYPTIGTSNFSNVNNNSYINYTLKFNSPLSIIQLQSPNYYIDYKTTVVPSIITLRVDGTLDPSYIDFVCGILCFNVNKNYNLWTSINDFGYYYFANNPILLNLLSNSSVMSNYTFDNINTPLYKNINGTTYDTPLTSTVYLKWIIALNYQIYTPTNQPYFNLTCSNLLGSSSQTNIPFGLPIYQDLNNLKLFFDSLSITVKNATLNPNWSPTGPNYGCRVESGNNIYSSDFHFCKHFTLFQTFSCVYVYSQRFHVKN